MEDRWSLRTRYGLSHSDAVVAVRMSRQNVSTAWHRASRRCVIVAVLVFVGLIDIGLTTDAAQPTIDLSDPEQTIDAYYRGLRTDDQAMVEKTLLRPRRTAPFDGGALH